MAGGLAGQGLAPWEMFEPQTTHLYLEDGIPFSKESNGYINPYYWVDEFIPHGSNGSW